MAPRPYRDGPVPPRPHLPDTMESIVLVRLSARGDVVFSTPVIRAFRKRYPDARITFVVESPAADLVEGHPEVDQVVVWDRGAWKRLLKERRFRELWRAYRSFRDRLREREHDLAVDLQGRLRSGWVAWLSRARLRIGLGSREGSSLLVHHRHPVEVDIDHMSADYRLLAEWLGLDTEEWLPEVHLAPEAEAGARKRLAEEGVTGDYILLVPFTTRPWKHWVEERWAPLAGALGRETGLPLVLAGGPGDRPGADRIMRGVHEAADGETPAVTDLVGRTTLGEAAALVAGAALVVGVDTGLTHVAHAFRRPTICLFGPSAYSVPPTPVARVIRHDLACAPCIPRGGHPTCGGAWTCMDLITREQVLGHARELLAEATP